MTTLEFFAEMGSSRLFYIDPGSGTLLIQLVIAAILGASVAAGKFWRTIFRKASGLLRNVQKEKPENNDKHP